MGHDLTDLERRVLRKASDCAATYVIERAAATLQELNDRSEYRYTECGPPSKTNLDAARSVLRLAVSDLNLLNGIPYLRWFGEMTAAEKSYRDQYGPLSLEEPDVGVVTLPVSDRPLWGLAERAENTVWVRADLPLPDLLATTAHEVAHLAENGNEAFAQAYEAQWVATLPTFN